MPLIDKILAQKPHWLNPADVVEGSQDPVNDDVIIDSDGEIVKLPQGDSNRVVGTLWAHIKSLCNIIIFGHNNDGSHHNKIQLTDLSDINDSLSPTDNQILVYDSTSGLWTCEDLSTSVPAHELAQHVDVNDSLSPNDGEALVYDATLGYWTSRVVGLSDGEVDGGTSSTTF